MPSISPYRRQALTPSLPSHMGVGSSHRTAGSVTPPHDSWSRYVNFAGSQSDTDSTLRNSSSSKSSGSCTEATVSDATDSITMVSGLPLPFHKPYQALAPVLGYSDAELMKLDVSTLEVTHTEIHALLRGVILAGYSCRWAEFDKLHTLWQRISDIINVKKEAKPPREVEVIDFRGVPGLEFTRESSWVAMTAEDWQETYKDTADTNYLTGLYRNAMAPSIFSWEDVGAAPEEDKEIGDHPGRIHTLDYCAF
ncbi:hypothetical protein DFH94DRAFT_202019 [Russula ochroleuca]|uniref:Uncharacterized protein n=1 Tax=Russula ochroleuca TaxID=152965 RepID=A0A9P5JYX0_9AGAM|nr:hypothetical protein DFH94DRAFT_202019 [Russula ochroleuca]